MRKMVLLIFIFLYIIVTNLIVLEEETIIIIAGFVWYDAVEDIFDKLADEAIIEKSDNIKNDFKKYLIEELLMLEKLDNVLLKIQTLGLELKNVNYTSIKTSIYLHFIANSILDVIDWSNGVDLLSDNYGLLIYNIMILEDLQFQLFSLLSEEQLIIYE